VTLSLSATPLSTQNPTKRSGKERGEVSSTPFLYTTCFTCIYLHTNGNGVPARKPPLHSFGAPPDRRRVLASCVPESCFGRSWVGPASAESESEKRKTAIQARGNSFASWLGGDHNAGAIHSQARPRGNFSGRTHGATHGFGHSGGHTGPIWADGGPALLLSGSPARWGVSPARWGAAAVFCLYFAPAPLCDAF
jgi:hypothetical protein